MNFAVAYFIVFQQLKKQTEETNKIYDELVQKDQELIRMRRINQVVFRTIFMFYIVVGTFKCIG